MQEQIPNELYIGQKDYYGWLTSKPVVPDGEVWVFCEREGSKVPPTVIWGNGESQNVPSPGWFKNLKKTIYCFWRHAEYPYVLRMFKESNLWLEFKTSIAVTLSDPVGYMDAQRNRASNQKRRKTQRILEIPLHTAFQTLLSFDSPRYVSTLAPRDLQPVILSSLVPQRDISSYVQQGFPDFAEIGVEPHVRVLNAASSPDYQRVLNAVLNAAQEDVSQLRLWLTNSLDFLDEQKGAIAIYMQAYTLIGRRYDFIFQTFRPVIEYYVSQAYRGNDQFPNPAIISMLFKDLINEQISALLSKHIAGYQPNYGGKFLASPAQIEPSIEHKLKISKYPTQSLAPRAKRDVNLQPSAPLRQDIERQQTARIDDLVESKQNLTSAEHIPTAVLPTTLLPEEATSAEGQGSSAPSQSAADQQEIEHKPRLLSPAQIKEQSKPMLQLHSQTETPVPELKEAPPASQPSLKGREQPSPLLHEASPPQAAEAPEEKLASPQLVPPPSQSASPDPEPPALSDSSQAKTAQDPSPVHPQNKRAHLQEPLPKKKPSLSLEGQLLAKALNLPSPLLGDRARVIRDVQLSALYRAQPFERWEIYPPYDKVHDVIYVQVGNGYTVQIFIPEAYPDALPVIQATYNSQKISQQAVNSTIDPVLASRDYNLHMLVQAMARDLPGVPKGSVSSI